MEIVFILPGRGNSGGVRVTVTVANRLLERGHNVRIMYRKPSIKKQISIFFSDFFYEGCIDWLKMFEGAVLPYRDLAKCKFEASEMLVSVGMWCSAQLDILRELPNPKLQYIHGLAPWMPEIMRQALSSPLPKVAVSSNIPEAVSSYGGGEVKAVIPNGIDTSEYYPSLNGELRDGVGTIYSDHPAKAPDVILRVLQNLKIRKPNIPHYVFGSSPRPSQISRAEYKHFPSVQQVRQIYSRSKVWILASNSEGFPAPVLEAMACGCAVVSTGCGGVGDIIKDGFNGLIVDVGDTEQITEKVMYLLDDEKLRKQLVSNARDTVQGFNWNDSVDRLEKVLEQVCV